MKMLSDRIYKDQLDRIVHLPGIPQKIISVVPSQTELLFDLGLKDRIAGITKFCIHPSADAQNAIKIGGTKQLNIELIKSLQPDLIIANKEENDRAQIEELMQHFPVWISDISNLAEAVQMITSIGEITDKSTEANKISGAIVDSFNSLKPILIKKTLAYFIWRKPYMLAGKRTFIDDMLTQCGFVNAIEQDRYPEITIQSLVEIKPDVVFLSSEPYPFAQKHIDELTVHLPQSKIYLVDGEMFSWYGSRLLHSIPYFQEIIKSVVNEA